MEQSRLHETEARCTQEALPRCRAGCPFRLDVRAFMEAMAGGRTREAGKILERHLPLPEIMARVCDHPCEDLCLRRDLGGSLAISALEAACLGGTEHPAASFPRAPKPWPMAVIGNGLAGLVAAFDLSRKAYPVTVFHSGEAHGALLAFPAIAEDLARAECAALVKAGCVFSQKTPDAALLEEIQKNFAAVFVDAEAAPEAWAALNALPDPLTRLLRDNICAGGLPERTPTGALYRSPSRQAGEGRRAAVTMERLAARVSLTAGREAELSTRTPLFTPLDKVTALEAVLPRGEGYTLEEAAEEAARCIRCECLACVRECVYLQKYGAYPKSYTRQIYNNASIVKGEHRANSLINGCMLCGQCTELCPERFSMAELCLSARRDMVTGGHMPPTAHEFALEDMASAGESALFAGDPEGQKNAWIFFPGCQLAASRGEQVLAAYSFLRGLMPPEEGLGLFLACCGVPARWAGEEKLFQKMFAKLRAEWEKLGRPTLIMACATCLKTFREAAPDMAATSLWEFLEPRFTPQAPLPVSETRVIHDPCAARYDEGWQKAVRSLAARCGLALTEPRRGGLSTACCGYGGLVWSAQPELADLAAERRARDLGGPALASCIMCCDRFTTGGGDCVHMFDILPFSKGLGETAPPGLSARRANRAALSQKARALFLNERPGAEAKYSVEIPPAVLLDLERKHILRDDVEGAVKAVEAAGGKFLERDSGHYVGAWRPRKVTFWVRYSVIGEGRYQLHDAWSHRMIVPGAGS